MKASVVKAEVDAALGEVETAAHALETLLKELQIAPRAEKVQVSTAIETAFTRLRSARDALAKLHDAASRESDEG